MIVDIDELAEYMSGMKLDVPQRDTLEDVLAGIQDDLERHLQRPLERMERTELIWPDDMGRLWPKATPVQAVSTYGYTAGGGSLSNQIVAANMVGGYGYSGSMFGGTPGPVEVTYVGGLAGRDETAVRLAIMRVAAREATTRHDDTLDPNDLTARKVEDRDKAPLGWTDAELKRFDRLRRRTVV